MIYEGGRWTRSMDEKLMNIYESHTMTQLCRIFKMSSKRVFNRAKKLGIIECQSWTKEELLYVRENYCKIGATACAKHLGKSKRSVVRYANSINITSEKDAHLPDSVCMIVDGTQIHRVQYGRNSLECHMMHMKALWKTKYPNSSLVIVLKKHGITLKEIFKNEIQAADSSAML